MHWDHKPVRSLVAANRRRMIPPLLGERAGVRESLWVWNILPEMPKCLETNNCTFSFMERTANRTLNLDTLQIHQFPGRFPAFPGQMLKFLNFSLGEQQATIFFR